MIAAPHGTNRLTVLTVVPIVGIHVARVEVEVAPVVRVVRIERRRPVVSVGARVVEIRTVAVTGGREK